MSIQHSDIFPYLRFPVPVRGPTLLRLIHCHRGPNSWIRITGATVSIVSVAVSVMGMVMAMTGALGVAVVVAAGAVASVGSATCGRTQTYEAPDAPLRRSAAPPDSSVTSTTGVAPVVHSSSQGATVAQLSPTGLTYLSCCSGVANGRPSSASMAGPATAPGPRRPSCFQRLGSS